MKKLLLLLCTIILLSSCATQQATYTNLYDYSYFNNKGIFVTEAKSVSFDYTPIGSIVSTTIPGSDGFVFNNIRLEEAFNQLSKKLIDIDANGLLGLEIRPVQHCIVITGMAFRTDKNSIKPKLEINSYNSNLYIIDGIKCNLIEALNSGVVFETNKELNKEQISKVMDFYKIRGKLSQFYLEDSNKAYAGTTEDGYIVNYKTNEFTKY